MSKNRRFLSAFLALLAFVTLLCPLFSLESLADGPEGLDEGSSVLIYHNESGKVLYKKGAETPVSAGPAPRMTAALLFLEHYGDDLEKTVTVNRRVTGLASSTMNPGLKGGEELSVYDLLCGMLVANSDDAVYALAFDLYENAENAPELLLAAINDKAKSLGMTDTRFVNVTGNDPQSQEMLASYSSLSDLLKLSLALQEQPTLLAICAIDDVTLAATNKSGSRRLLTRNYLLSAKRIGGYTYKYATGLAANEGPLSGYHVLATAKIENKTFTCISVGAREQYAAFTDAATLFKWADGAFGYKKVLDHTAILGEITVKLSNDSDYVTVAPEKDLTAFLPADLDVEKDLRVQTHLEFTQLTAPVGEGLIVGSVTVYYGDEAVGTTRLVTTGSLSMSNSRYYLTMAARFFETPLFLSLAAGVVLFLVVCVLAGARVQYLRKNRPTDLSFIEEEDDRVAADGEQGTDGLFARIRRRIAEKAAEKRAKKAKQAVKTESEHLKKKEPTPKTEAEPTHLPLREDQAAPVPPSARGGRSLTKEGGLAQKQRLSDKRSETKAVQNIPEKGQNAEKVLQNGQNTRQTLQNGQKAGETLQRKSPNGRRLTGAKRLPGADPERQAKEQQRRQGGYVPSGWGSRKDEKEE